MHLYRIDSVKSKAVVNPENRGTRGGMNTANGWAGSLTIHYAGLQLVTAESCGETHARWRTGMLAVCVCMMPGWDCSQPCCVVAETLDTAPHHPMVATIFQPWLSCLTRAAFGGKHPMTNTVSKLLPDFLSPFSCSVGQKKKERPHQLNIAQLFKHQGNQSVTCLD